MAERLARVADEAGGGVLEPKLHAKARVARDEVLRQVHGGRLEVAAKEVQEHEVLRRVHQGVEAVGVAEHVHDVVLGPSVEARFFLRVDLGEGFPELHGRIHLGEPAVLA